MHKKQNIKVIKRCTSLWRVTRPLHDLKCFLLSHFCYSGTMFWVIVMLEDLPMTHLHCSCWAKEVFIKILTYIAPVIGPSMWSSCPIPLAQKLPQNILYWPPCSWDCGNAFLWVIKAFIHPLNVATLSPWSSESFRCSLANLRQTCTCAFWAGGTLQAL